MNSIKIKPSKVKGSVKISGSKNSALPIIVGALMNQRKVTLKNIPKIQDIDELISISQSLGSKVKRCKDTLIIKNNLQNKDILYESCKKFRASYYLMGLYLAKFNHVKIYMPGGCNIGKRPIDYHLQGFEALGCKYKITGDIIEIALIRPTPCTISLPKKSLGATVNLVLLASCIEGQTTIKNISLEPELIDFINFMKIQGVNLELDDTTLKIYGVKNISKKVKYTIIPDRIEASTYLCLGLITNKIKIKKINKEHLQNIIAPLKENNAKIIENKNSLIVKKSKIKPFKILSAEYPKLSTDIFPMLIPIFAFSKGRSTIKETIYENRFEVARELSKIGVKIKIVNNECHVLGIEDCTNNECCATDLRCAASLLIYAISSKKEIIINNFDIINRGYSDILSKLNSLGVKFEII